MNAFFSLVFKSIVLTSLILGPGLSAAILLEDFEDVSDWTPSFGSGAISATVGQNGPEAQVGSFAGEFTAEHDSDAGFNYIRFDKTLATSFDFSDPLTEVSFYFKTPSITASRPFVNFALYNATAGAGDRIEMTLHSNTSPYSTGSWEFVTLTNASFGTVGSLDFTDINAIRVESVGDVVDGDFNGGTTIYNFDQIQVIPEPSTLILVLAGFSILGFGMKRRSARKG